MSSNLEELTYRELQAICREKNLSASGKRAQLIARLSEAGVSDLDDEEGEEEERNPVSDEGEEEEEEEEEDQEEEEVVSGEEDEDDEEEDELADGEMGDILGVLVRRPRDEDAADDGEEEGDDDEVVFIPADQFADLYESDSDEDGVYVDEDGNIIDDYDIDGDDDEDIIDDIDDDEMDSLFDDYNQQRARVVSGSLLALEFLVFFASLVLQGKVHAENVTNKPISERPTFFIEFFTALFQSSMETAFWQNLFAYLVLLVVVPTALGLLLGKPSSPDSVLGFAVSRYAIFHMVEGLSFFKAFAAFLHPPLFNVTCAVSLIMAFWENQL